MKEHDNEIISGLKSGNENSYKLLFDEYYLVLSVFAAKYVNNLETAKEIVQEFFVYLFENREKLNITISLKSFLFQSVKNRCLNHIKHSQIQKKYIDSLNVNPETSVDFEENIKAAELEYQIFQVVKSMPGQCRRIFEMSRTKGYNNSEIADMLGISKRTVETQISKALKIIRQKLRGFLQLIF